MNQKKCSVPVNGSTECSPLARALRRQRFVSLGIGVTLIVVCGMECHRADQNLAYAPATAVDVEIVPTAAVVGDVADRNEQLARSNPLGFIQFCWDRYRREVRDYRCTFVKQEFIGGRVLPAQTADVRFMEEPYSVDMTFVENIRQCRRALYVAGKWLDSAGNEQAWAKPGGAILRAIIPRIKQPIHGARAKKASRRTIDQFGFGKTFELVVKYCRKAEAESALQFEYVGRGVIDGRPTYVFERRLPYNGDESHYPDRLLVLHMDQELLLPTACFAYSDDQGAELLGNYVYRDVQLNQGYTPDDFDPDKIDF